MDVLFVLLLFSHLVGLMLIAPDRRVFVGCRANQPDAWQMPQGGIDKGETPVEAACRELHEEVGTTKALLLRESAGEETDGLGDWWTRYQDVSDSERRSMIRDLSSKDDGPGAPRKRKRSGSKRKRSPAADGSSPSAGE